MIGSVLVLPHSRVAEIEGNPTAVLIAITDPHAVSRARTGWADVLRLQFSDATRPSHTVSLFSEQDAENIKKFCAHWHKVSEQLQVVIHCEYGLSRSAAIGLCISRAFRAPITTFKNAHDLAEARPLPDALDLNEWGVVTPNVRVLEMLCPIFLRERKAWDYNLMLVKQNSIAELLVLE